MRVDVVLSAGAVTTARVLKMSVGVIDVFRATTVMVEALHNGARMIVPVATIPEAQAVGQRYGCDNVLMGGEREMKLIEGFDLDNSPAAYRREVVQGKIIVQTTTNGTRAIINAERAHDIYIGAFLNVGALAKTLASTGRDVVMVCAGLNDRYTAEDGLCAGAVVDILARYYDFEMTDIAQVMREVYLGAESDLRGRLSTTTHFQNMMAGGYGGDIEMCLRRDIYDTVPRYNQRGELVIDDDDNDNEGR